MSGAWTRLDHVWRVFATGLSFAVFGIGACVISATLFPLIRLATWRRGLIRQRIQHAMHYGFALFVWMMKTLGIMTWEVRNRERLLRPGQLIVANHPSLIDVVVLISLIPSVDCIVKRGLWLNPFLRWPVLWASYIPNNTPHKLVEDCAATLRAGHSLIVFPEGTRTVPGQPPAMKRGAAQIALAAQAQILPVRISVTPTTLTKNEPWYRVPERPFHVCIDVGEPFSPSAVVAAEASPSLGARRLTQHFEHYLSACGAQPQPL